MRGAQGVTKVHYQGNDDDFIIYADSAKAVQDWQSAYTPKGDGYDVTFHQTTKGDAIIEFTTTGTHTTLPRLYANPVV